MADIGRLVKGLAGVGIGAAGVLSGNPLLMNAGLQVGGGLLGSAILGDGPEVPDTVNPITKLLEKRKAGLLSDLGYLTSNTRAALKDRTQGLQEDLAAAGATGSGGVAQLQALFDANNRALSDVNRQVGSGISEIEGLIDDEIAKAAQEQADRTYNAASQKYASRAQAISNILQSLSNFQTLHSLTAPPEEPSEAEKLRAAEIAYRNRAPLPTPAYSSPTVSLNPIYDTSAGRFVFRF